jgi:hypothetical protein
MATRDPLRSTRSWSSEGCRARMPRLTCHSVARGSDAVMAARRLAQPSGAESRPIVDKAAVAVGRDSADVDTICKVSGRLTGDPLPRTRDDNGSWIGGGVT